MEFSRKVFIPNHVIDQYRERVVEDDLRYQSGDSRILDILQNALNRAIPPTKIGSQTRILISFDFNGNQSQPYYLAISPKRETEDLRVKQGPYVAKTLLCAERGRQEFSRALMSSGKYRGRKRKC